MLHINQPFPVKKAASYGLMSLGVGFFGTVSLLMAIMRPDIPTPVTTNNDSARVQNSQETDGSDKPEAAKTNGTADTSTNSAGAWSDLHDGSSTADIVAQPPTGSTASESVVTAPAPVSSPVPTVAPAPISSSTSVSGTTLPTAPVTQDEAPVLLEVQVGVPVVDAQVEADTLLNVSF